jgi:hypothetical protein
MMRTILLAFILSYCSQSFSAELYVIANSALSIAADEVKSIFKGDTEFSGSIKLEPTDNNAAQAVFLSKVMEMDKAKYESWWVKKSFRDGTNQPPARATDMEVIEFVKKTPGGVGYVTTQPAGVKVIQQF